MQTIVVSSDGVITLTLKHWADSFDSITVTTDQGSYEIKVLMKDFFPSNFRFKPFSFYSSFRSHDGTARRLWKANYVSHLTIPAFDTVEVIAHSDDTGYLDKSRLLSDCLAIGSEGVIELTTIAEQTGTGSKDIALAEDSKPAYAGNVQAGILNLLLQNGRPYFTSIWTPSQFNSNWLDVQRTGCEYILAFSPDSEYSGFYATYCMQRRIGVDFASFHAGDDNAYPGFVAVSGIEWKFNTNNNPANLILNFIREWGVGTFSSTTTSPLNSIRLSGYFRLATTDTRFSSRDIVSSSAHSGSGIKLAVGNWDFSEFAIYDIGTSGTDGTSLRSNYKQIVNNLVAVFGGARFDYT